MNIKDIIFTLFLIWTNVRLILLPILNNLRNKYQKKTHQISDLVHEEKFKSHPKGFIGLQVHGIRKGSGPFEVSWRNLEIIELK